MGAETIQEISTIDRQAMKRFASLERKLLGEYPLYVSNFDTEVIRHLSGNSPAGRRMYITLFIASDGNRDVARCAALINPKYQEAKNEKVGFIGYFAAAPGCESGVTAMFQQAESWLKQRGITRVIAPFNGSALLGYGVLTDGFEEEPVIFNGWNPPYYPAYLTQACYQPKYPMLVYTSDFSSENYRAAKEHAVAKHDFQLRPINKKLWRSELEIFREVINENFTKEWLWYPITQDEFLDSFEAMKPMIDPRQMVIAEVQGKPAGVVIAYPNWNPLVRSFQGKMGNMQKIQFLLRGGHYETAGTAIVAVRSEYRGRGIGPALKIAVFQRYEVLGLKKAYGYTVDEDNLASRKMNEAVGAMPRLLYHAYDKII
jgi:GNAT superfamily N-acetyltransferase